LDFFAIGVAAYPYTMAEYYTMQEEMNKRKQDDSATGDVISEQEIDLDLNANANTE
jgi:hypothetical protein